MEWKTVRIFISSTFNDMHAERDYLVKQVFPELTQWCEERCLRLIDIDLRWGITTEDSQSNNAVGACLNNIDGCRPFFICFLGQRRGWIPERQNVSRNTCARYPDLQQYLGKHSITELEIEHALLAPMLSIVEGMPYTNVPAKHALFFIRNDPFTNLNDAQKHIYTNSGSDQPDREDSALAALKQRILEKWPNVAAYDCVWDQQLVTTQLITEGTDAAQGRLRDFSIQGRPFKELLLEQLKREITDEFPNHIPDIVDTPEDEDIQLQRQFVDIHTDGFIPREDCLVKLDAYVASKDTRPLLLYKITKGDTIKLAREGGLIQ